MQLQYYFKSVLVTALPSLSIVPNLGPLNLRFKRDLTTNSATFLPFKQIHFQVKSEFYPPKLLGIYMTEYLCLPLYSERSSINIQLHIICKAKD